MTGKLFNFLKNKIIDKKIILFGEIHGTKETPLLFSDFLSEYALIKDFDVCLEIPVNEQENISKFLATRESSLLKSPSLNSKDGRNSFEMKELIKNISSLKKKIHCIDLDYELQLNKIQDRDKIMAENILKNLKNKQVIVLLGNFHASKNKIIINNDEFETTGYLLKKKLEDSLITINLMPEKGTFFNNALKRIENSSNIKEFYDHTFNIGEVTPCSF